MHLYVDLGKHYIILMALVGFSASAVQALTYQNGDYIGSLNKKASGAQCFIKALGLFWDIVTGLPWTPNGVCSFEPRGYCTFLPGAHYLTINSPYGADSSLNKILLLLLPLACLSLPRKLYAWYSILPRNVRLLPQHFLDWPWLGVSYHTLTNSNISGTLLIKFFKLIPISIEKSNTCTLVSKSLRIDFIDVLSGWNYNYSEHTVWLCFYDAAFWLININLHCTNNGAFWILLYWMHQCSTVCIKNIFVYVSS